MDSKIEKKVHRYLETAMPKLIPQSELDIAYVNKWKKAAENHLKYKKPSPIEGFTTSYPLYHLATSNTRGVWYISEDGKTIDYLYAYQSIKLQKPKAAEALAYLFSPGGGPNYELGVRGVTRDIFFNYLLPQQKFVVTDSIYTPDGYRWFQSQYAFAFRTAGYVVYAWDMKRNEVRQIAKEEFKSLQTAYWGETDEHQLYRFAIELVG